jgi:hypothetical protein
MKYISLDEQKIKEKYFVKMGEVSPCEAGIPLLDIDVRDIDICEE